MHDFFKTRRFIGMLALLMGLTALSIDTIIPAFPNIIEDFSISKDKENSIQLTILIFMLGFSCMQLIFGILADIYGRKSILLLGLAIYIIASILALYVPNYNLLLIARFFQGVGVGAPRVLTLAIVRDVASGRAMSRLMSFVLMVFLIIPIIAPMIGQWVIYFGGWQSIFMLFAGMATLALLWTVIELPETLAPEQRYRFSLQRILSAIKACLTDLNTLLLLLILGLLFGMLIMYISQFELIFQSGVYKIGDSFVYIFAAIAGSMVLSAITNSRLVMHKGLQQMILIGLAIMFLADGILLLMTSLYAGKPPMILLIVLLMFHFFAYSILMPNFNSLIMQPYKQIAGTASALIGSIMTFIAVGVAHLVGREFNHTLYPMSIAYFCFIVVVASLTLLIFKYADELVD